MNDMKKYQKFEYKPKISVSESGAFIHEYTASKNEDAEQAMSGNPVPRNS